MMFEEILERDGYLIYKTRGTSMLPLLRQNKDVVVIETVKDKQLVANDVVLFKRKKTQKDEYVLHRILKVFPEDKYWIVGDNCMTGEYVSKEDILGILTKINRNNHIITDKNVTYRVYMNTWCRFYRVRFFILRVKRAISKIVHVLKKGLTTLNNH